MLHGTTDLYVRFCKANRHIRNRDKNTYLTLVPAHERDISY